MRWIIPLVLFALVLPVSAWNGSADTGGYEVIITELLPDPAGTDIDGEFIEMMNVGSAPAELLNWSLTDQDGPVDLIFPDVTLRPGERLVAHVGPGENRTENGVIHLYMWKGFSMLNNGGDDVLILDSDGNPVDYVAYGNGSMVDPPPEGMAWDERIEPVSGLSISLSSTGLWFNAIPSPGEKNPDMDAGKGAAIRSFYAYARASDEFVELSNPSDKNIDLFGCYITDGEGYAYLPYNTTIAPHSSIYLTQNGSGFFSEMAFPADLTYDECYTPSSYPEFANHGDELELCSPSGEKIFSVSYGDGRELDAPERGEVYVYENGWEREKIGRSSFPPFNLSFNGTVFLFSAPESSLKAIKNAIKSAENEIIINVYEFTSQEIAQELMGAMARGVSVKILLEGDPVGGIPDNELYILHALSSAGADIRLEMGNESAGMFQRYRYDHAKYMIIDSREIAVESENFNSEAMSCEGKNGNRGWGVIIRNGSAARYLREIFLRDSNLNFSDIVRLRDMSFEIPEKKWAPVAAEGSEPLELNGSFNISILPGPENGLDEIIDAINSANHSIYVESFYITHEWRYGDCEVQNPLISALLNASIRGCEVKVLMDSFYYNTDGSDDNDELVDYLNSFGKENNVSLEARLIDLNEHGLVKIHNKGMIIDGKTTLISSFNWGQNSFTNNREMAVMMENRDAAEYFTSLFMEDWKSDFTPPVALIECNGNITERASVLVNVSSVFSAESSYDDSGISGYQWVLDDSNISCNSSIILNFTSPGEHMLTLVVHDIEGNLNNTSIRIEVRQPSPLDEVDEIEHIIEGYSNNMTVQNPVNESSHNSTVRSTAPDAPPEDDHNEPGKTTENSALWQYFLIFPAIVVLISAAKISFRKGKNQGS